MNNQYKLLVNRKGVVNREIQNLYKINYADNKEFPPEYQYDVALTMCDYYFHLVDNNSRRHSRILASCSANIQDNGEYQFDDVYVEEKYRGNHYALILLERVIQNIKEDNRKNVITIKGHLTNLPAVKTYRKAFGKPHMVDDTYEYFAA